MAILSKLTSRESVELALAEYRSLGREAFLERYGFAPSRDYFIRDEQGGLFDSKPIVAAAYAIENPSEPILRPTSFSGGNSGAVPALRRLGFEVVTPAQVEPPSLGDTYASRTEIYERFGGDKVAGIIRFPGDPVVNVFSDANGPYADDPPSLAAPFGYRGEGLNGPQLLNSRGNSLLESVRVSRIAARFWYRPKGEDFTFFTWVAVLGRAWVMGVGQDGEERPELLWNLEAVPTDDPATWPESVIMAIEQAAETSEYDPVGPEVESGATYGDLVARVEARGQREGRAGKPRIDYPRSAAARRAVLIRSGGLCESPWCTGMPAEKNRQGGPILEVDHVEDLATGGADHPENMVALCPNCHASKTHGANVGKWRRELKRVAARAHKTAIA